MTTEPPPMAAEIEGDYSEQLLDKPLRDYLRRCRAVTEAHQARDPKWTEKDQLLKIYEEVGELHEALKHDAGNDPTNYEICDIMLAAITMFHLRMRTLAVSGFDPDRDIAFWLDKTLRKIEERVQL